MSLEVYFYKIKIDVDLFHHFDLYKCMFNFSLINKKILIAKL